MATLKNKFKCSQNTIIWLCWCVYTLAYLGRYSYNANINLIMRDFGTNHAEAGLVTTFFFFSYGIGQVVNGIMCKRYNKKFIFPIVLDVLLLLYAKYMYSIDHFQYFFWNLLQKLFHPLLLLYPYKKLSFHFVLQ